MSETLSIPACAPAVPAAPGPEPVGPTLSLARYRYTAVFDRDLVLRQPAGSLLRSIFGLALRQGVCITGRPQCGDCPAQPSCAYPALFEPLPRVSPLGQRLDQAPSPCVMEPPLDVVHLPAGQPLQWQQVLIGAQTQRQLPLVVQAWERSLRNGWERERVTGRLLDVAQVNLQGRSRSIRDARSGRLQPEPAAVPLQAPRPVNRIVLEFVTPLRLQHEGRPLKPAELSPRKLVADLLRRCLLMLDFHLDVRPAPFDIGTLLALAQTLQDDRSGLHWSDGQRYSARQQQTTPVGGVLGTWVLSGELGPLLPWLRLGQWLHLGKGTAMGQGAYSLYEEA
ncbi:MAG: hypothetical protein RLZZ182_2704 [Pseudomonadota bacterium]|jgi:hypothetical protein